MNNECLPSDTNSSRTERDSLQDIRRTTDTAVDKDLKVGVGEHFALLEFVDDLYEDFDTRSGEFLNRRVGMIGGEGQKNEWMTYKLSTAVFPGIV